MEWNKTPKPEEAVSRNDTRTLYGVVRDLINVKSSQGAIKTDGSPLNKGDKMKVG